MNDIAALNAKVTAARAALADALDQLHGLALAENAPTVRGLALATATPTQVDTVAALVDDTFHGAVNTRGGVVKTLIREAARALAVPARGLTAAEAIDWARERAEVGAKPWEFNPASLLAKLDAADAAFASARAEHDLIQAEYERRPWTRYVGVAGGHIHSGMWCAGGTIRPTTLRGWQPKLSGRSVAEAIEALQTTMCTHCFPDAPIVAAPPAEDKCAGSGRGVKAGTYRSGSPSRGVCTGCDTMQTLTPSGWVRKHRAA